MCLSCASSALTRRSVLRFGAAAATLGLAGRAFASSSAPAHQGQQAHQEPEAHGDKHAPATDTVKSEKPAMSPGEALARLKAGNKAFVRDANACATHLAARRTEIAGGQHPWATILTCSDSRVAPELVFGSVSLGELFVVRNAGNVLDTAALGTIEYGAEHLHSPLVVVMGHQKCGAVAAACDVVGSGAVLPGSIGKMVQPILPVALKTLFKSNDFVGHTIKANAQEGAIRIMQESHIVAKLIANGNVEVVAAVYDLDSGVVEFIDAA